VETCGTDEATLGSCQVDRVGPDEDVLGDGGLERRQLLRLELLHPPVGALRRAVDGVARAVGGKVGRAEVFIAEVGAGVENREESVHIHLGEQQVGREPVLRVLEAEEHDEGEDLDEHDQGAAVHEDLGEGIEEPLGGGDASLGALKVEAHHDGGDDVAEGVCALGRAES